MEAHWNRERTLTGANFLPPYWDEGNPAALILMESCGKEWGQCSSPTFLVCGTRRTGNSPDLLIKLRDFLGTFNNNMRNT